MPKEKKHNIISNGSCTTNCLAPVAMVMDNGVGIESGFMTTIHSYTGDQRTVDQSHSDLRRARGAAISMIPTSTGAAKALSLVLPKMKGKLDGTAIRVPTPNGSLAIISLELDKQTSVESVNAIIKNAALKGDMVNQIYYSIDPELVSNDIIGNTCCAVFDSNATLVSNDGKNVVLYTWYDNEFGYTKQVIRLAKYITKVRRKIYY